MSETVKGKTTQWRKGYDVGYKAACCEIRRRMTQSYGYRLERAYLGTDATTPPDVDYREVPKCEK